MGRGQFGVPPARTFVEYANRLLTEPDSASRLGERGRPHDRPTDGLDRERMTAVDSQIAGSMVKSGLHVGNEVG